MAGLSNWEEGWTTTTAQRRCAEEEGGGRNGGGGGGRDWFKVGGLEPRTALVEDAHSVGREVEVQDDLP